MSDDSTIISNYIDNHFPANFKVSANQIDQLSWVLDHNVSTNDLDLYIKSSAVHTEVSRALTRLYCSQLLRSGTRDSYNAFVAAQLQSNITEPLTFVTFNKLSKHIQSLQQNDYELLEVAAILAAVGLSEPATTLANKIVDQNPPLKDNLDFLSITLRNYGEMYPIAQQVMLDNTAAKKLLYILFPPQTNFRHMLYTEGGVGMFNSLRTMITHGYIDRSELDLLYASWIVNTAGFRGHILQNGSVYLTEPVAQAILKLQTLTYQILDFPTYNPLLPYLEYRAHGLGLQNLPYDDKLFITHLGCLMRLYNVSQGQRLYASVMKLPKNQRIYAMNYFLIGLDDPTQRTPTYVPALFGNILAATNGDIEKVIAKILPAYNEVLRQYIDQKQSNVLSFYKLASRDNIQYLLTRNDSNNIQRFHIDTNGTVTIS